MTEKRGLPRLRLPDPSRPNRYEHRRPRRPSRLAKRLTPPPIRPGTPDMRWFLYVGIALAVLIVVLSIPYLIAYVVDVLAG
ncbi:MAG TPA: hypothetical protein VHK06_06310 [Candidatus Limnocylindria bacterium]|nr:hypothetical protein [Candidatus Limnocylindria bacterium]